MATRQTAAVMRRVRKVADHQGEQASDRELLRRFAGEHDEGAFSLLVRRHSSLVLGGGRRVPRHHRDAEAVGQATFLFLARKAGKVAGHDSVAGWLYRAAYH